MVRIRTLSDFQGVWSVVRQIRHQDGSTARFLGQAQWIPDARGLLYRESGQLTIAGHPPVTASRSYVWHPDLTVYFDDGRFFHTVPPQGGRAEHRCDPDQYEVTYDFSSWPDFRVDWQVTGPQKNYAMASAYRPISDG